MKPLAPGHTKWPSQSSDSDSLFPTILLLTLPVGEVVTKRALRGLNGNLHTVPRVEPDQPVCLTLKKKFLGNFPF